MEQYLKKVCRIHSANIFGVKHWHGAAKDSWFAHIAIEVPGENTSNEWLEPVSDEEYGGIRWIG